MAKYIKLKCRDCGYEKVYVERFADGRMCPKCGSKIFLPNIVAMTKEEHERMYRTHPRSK